MLNFIALESSMWANFKFDATDQPRPQGLPRGGARAEEDPGKIR